MTCGHFRNASTALKPTVTVIEKQSTPLPCNTTAYQMDLVLKCCQNYYSNHRPSNKVSLNFQGTQSYSIHDMHETWLNNSQGFPTHNTQVNINLGHLVNKTYTPGYPTYP